MSNDVIAGCIVTDVERLRHPMQKITVYIAHYKPSASITDLSEKNCTKHLDLCYGNAVA